jgi:hypothetical protein
VSRSGLDKEDIDVILRLLDHYKFRLERLKDRVQETNYSGMFLEDLDGSVNSTVNLLNRLKGVEAADTGQMTPGEVTLLARSMEIFLEDASSLQTYVKRELGRANIDTPSLEKYVSFTRNLKQRLRSEG